MDLIILIGIATSLLIVILTILFLKKNKTDDAPANNQPRILRAQNGQIIPRRAQIARNQRNRIRAPNANDVDNQSEDEDPIERPIPDFGDKIGTKKRAKLEAKAEKKAQREVELKIREDKKKKDEIADEERKKHNEQEKEMEKKQEEAEKIAREEKERKEYEEYLILKESFNVEEEGFEEGDENEKENQLQDFINYIKENKVVILEDLANHFKLKTQAVINRITDLQQDNTITGVIDDRGKFIYISEDELKSVAKFIKQRGRVSITELAQSSNNLIKLVPSVITQES